jgi:hypothetical protein
MSRSRVWRSGHVAPHAIADVDSAGALLVADDGDSNRSAEGLAVGTHEASEDVHRLSGRTPVANGTKITL